MPTNEKVEFTDLIREKVEFDTNLLDDKVLLKADGMPTYHLAVVVDDYLMQITHAFRGEEWLPSAPAHILIWKYLGWADSMPQWAHLPLILGPSGKLSKRDGAKYGFPVFARDWYDDKKQELTTGFAEMGFLPEAFLNLLVMLGWNDGTEKELFSVQEMIEQFDITRVHKGGAKFDFEKAKWYNHQYIQSMTEQDFINTVLPYFEKANITIADKAHFVKICSLVKDRCTLLSDFVPQANYFFAKPTTIDTESIAPKWTAEKKDFFETLLPQLAALDIWNAEQIEVLFKQLATDKNIKVGELQLPMRVFLVGGKYGPTVFVIAEHLGKEESIARVQHALELL
jgi:glutamyl-tRNA synthetase